MEPRRLARLTIKPQRLAGSGQCQNCGKNLEGAYCYYCGQPDRHLVRVFPTMMRELLEDAFDFDSRFARTIKPLLFRPGKLTAAYLEGKRFRYTPPLRLYIFTSMAFFVIAALVSSSTIHVSPPSESETPEEPRIQFNDRPWDRETNPVAIPGLPESINDWINDEIAESPRRLEAIKDDPGLIAEQLFDVLPQAMFLLLPFFALLLKFWYVFARRYYYEHLIFSLHNHAFMYICLVLGVGLEGLALWVDPNEQGILYRAVEWISIAILLWVPVYLLIAMKRMYKQGWILTVTKYVLVSISYCVMLTFTLLVAALVGFVNL